MVVCQGFLWSKVTRRRVLCDVCWLTLMRAEHSQRVVSWPALQRQPVKCCVAVRVGVWKWQWNFSMAQDPGIISTQQLKLVFPLSTCEEDGWPSGLDSIKSSWLASQGDTRAREAARIGCFNYSVLSRTVMRWPSALLPSAPHLRTVQTRSTQ